MKENEGVEGEWLYGGIENGEYWEIRGMVEYREEEGVFEDEMGEVMVGIGLVEMKD